MVLHFKVLRHNTLLHLDILNINQLKLNGKALSTLSTMGATIPTLKTLRIRVTRLQWVTPDTTLLVVLLHNNRQS